MTSETNAALEQLEARIAETVERHGELRARNAELEARLSELESKLERARAEAGDDGAGWRDERAELRRRVERLVAQLESLAES